MTLAINSVTSPKAPAPVFREKDAVCIEARPTRTTTTIKPVQPRSFQYQLAGLQITAQLLRHQSASPAASARDVAYAYRQARMAMTASTQEVRI